LDTVKKIKAVDEEDDPDIPYEYILYKRGYLANTNYLEIPHVLLRFLEIVASVEAEDAKLQRLNQEIAARHTKENGNV